MYNYEPIKSIKIKNFRNLGMVELSFEKSPIITLLGGNEAGKTSVMKAFTVCALHAYPRDQKGYIRDGTKFFAVAIETESGTKVLRIKEGTGVNCYKILDKDDNVVWEADKITDGLPQKVQDVMGLIEEPETKEFLHVRTYNDKLLFAETPNSTNYKVMYNALKVDNITRAINTGSKEANALKGEIGYNENAIQTLNEQLNETKVYDIDALVIVRSNLEELLGTSDKLEKAISLIDKVDSLERQLGALKLLDYYDLKPISELLVSRLNETDKKLEYKGRKEKESVIYKQAQNLEQIDTNSFKNITKLKGLVEDINKKYKEQSIINIEGLEEISESSIIKLGRLKHLTEALVPKVAEASILDTKNCNPISETLCMRLNKLDKLYNTNTILNRKRQLYNNEQLIEINLDIIDKISKVGSKCESVTKTREELSRVNSDIEVSMNKLKQFGVAIEQCPNCGSDVVIDISKLSI